MAIVEICLEIGSYLDISIFHIGSDLDGTLSIGTARFGMFEMTQYPPDLL